MIAYLSGKVLEITQAGCVLLTQGGVAYEISLPSHSLADLAQKGEVLSLYTCLVVREDAQELFGFSTWDERQMFILLTSINRVGARTALSILSIYRPDDLRRMVIDEDVMALSRVSGIGQKTAQQIFLELKYKLKASIADLEQGYGQDISTTNGSVKNVFSDALAGLINLGYEEQMAHGALKEVLKKGLDLDVPGALRAALKVLAKRS